MSIFSKWVSLGWEAGRNRQQNPSLASRSKFDHPGTWSSHSNPVADNDWNSDNVVAASSGWNQPRVANNNGWDTN